jgi:Meiotically up-regulated gene 113
VDTTVVKQKHDLKDGSVYVMRSVTKGYYKIGISECSPARRLHELRKAGPDLDIDHVATIPSTDCLRLERAFHRIFRSYKVPADKWNELDPSRNNLWSLARSEWFELNELQVELLCAMAETTGAEAANSAMTRGVNYHAQLFTWTLHRLNQLDSSYNGSVERYERLEERCDRLQERCDRLQAENDQIQATITHVQAENDQLHTALVAAQLDADREAERIAREEDRAREERWLRRARVEDLAF